MYLKARFESAKLQVRGFSKHLTEDDPSEPLERAIIRRETLDEEEEKRKSLPQKEWLGLFQTYSDAETGHMQHEERKLEQAARELAKAWSDFQGILSPEHRSRVDSPPDITVVWKALFIAEESYQEKGETRMGKVKHAVFKACESLEDHKELFHIFPTGDKYVSLVTGSISAIVKAAVNHQTVANGVSKALADIWDDIKYLRGLIAGPFNNDPVRPFVAIFYTEVFKVLVGILEHWHQSRLRRAVHSFNFNYVDKLIGNARSIMKELIAKVERQMQLERWNKVASKDDLLPIGDQLQLLLREQACISHSLELLRVEHRAQDAIAQDPDDAGTSPDTQEIPAPSDSGREFGDFKASAQHLEVYLQEGYCSSLREQTQGLSVKLEVFSTVQKWATTAKSSGLWVEGPFNTAVPSQNTLTSVSVLDTLRSMNLPVVFYYCRNTWEYDTDPPGDSEIVRMVYSLIHQILRTIPDSSPTPSGLCTSNVTSLNGSTTSLTCAMDLLETLLLAAPRTLFCLINGIQLLDDGSLSVAEEADLQRLVKLLCSLEKGPPLFKVLFTTDGFTTLLGTPASMDHIERCTYDHPVMYKRNSGGNASLMATLQQAVEEESDA